MSWCAGAVTGSHRRRWGGRRRATGLRREELAALAGISTDYLTRLEQGRARSPSSQVVASLSRALRLPDAEQDLLHRLAGYAGPGRDVASTRISGSVQRLLDRLTHTPVAVHDASGTHVVANAGYDALMGDTSTWRGIERNALWRNLLGPGGRVVHTAEEHAHLVAHQVADLRLSAARYPADTTLRRLVRQLTAQSPRFAELWESGSAQPVQDTSRRKTVDHPAVGRITLDCDSSSSPRRPTHHRLHRRTRYQRRRPPGPSCRPRHPGTHRAAPRLSQPAVAPSREGTCIDRGFCGGGRSTTAGEVARTLIELSSTWARRGHPVWTAGRGRGA